MLPHRTVGCFVGAIWVDITGEGDTANGLRDVSCGDFSQRQQSFKQTGMPLKVISQCFPKEGSWTVLTTGGDI